MSSPWTPLASPQFMGELPETPGKVSYKIIEKLPANATEILIYAFVTSKVACPAPHRGYYTISTSATSGATYNAYMNVLFDATSANSENIWLPLTENQAIDVELTAVKASSAKPTKRKAVGTRLAECMQSEEEVESGLFITGYR